jgi:YVTN family beta-propeller protein
VLATVAVGAFPGGVAVNPAGTRAYVANQNSNNVSVIDTASNTVVATVVVGTAPFGVAVNPAGTHAYVANVSSNNVSVIDTTSNTVVATVAVGTGPAVFGPFIGGVTAPPAPPTITNGPPLNGTVGVVYSFTYTSTGSPSFSVTAGSLPPGLSLSSAGVISGTPTTVGSFSGTVTATNGTAPDAMQNFGITIFAVAPPPGPTAVIPTLSESGMIFLALFMAGMAWFIYRRKGLR